MGRVTTGRRRESERGRRCGDRRRRRRIWQSDATASQVPRQRKMRTALWRSAARLRAMAMAPPGQRHTRAMASQDTEEGRRRRTASQGRRRATHGDRRAIAADGG